MLELYAVSALLMMVAALWLLSAFSVRNEQDQGPSQRKSQVAIFKQRLVELADERDTERLTEAQYQQALIETKMALRNELAPKTELVQGRAVKIYFWSAVLFLLTFTAVFYYVNGAHRQVKYWQDAVQALPELGKRALGNAGEPLSGQEMQQLALGLRTKLASDSSDPLAWLMLGQVAMTINDQEMALAALEQAYLRDPNRQFTVLSYAQALLLSGEQDKANKAAQLLAQVLQKDPANLDALSMLAYIAEQRGDLAEAKVAFEMLLSSLATDDPRRSVVQQRLSAVAEQIAVQQSQQAGAAQHADTSGEATGAASVSHQLQVSISLAAELQSQLPAQFTLFVTAKDANGSPMPAAVVKLVNPNLPLNVTLSRANAVMPTLNLDQLSSVNIEARVSISGNAIRQPGDWLGEVKAVATEPAGQVVPVVISTVIKD